MELGEGEVIKIRKKTFFKLSSFEKNPIIKPKDLGLTWCEGKDSKVGAVFNPGAEKWNGKTVLLPRCHKGYKKRRFFDEKVGIYRSLMDDYISEVWPLVSEDGVRFKRVDDIVIKGDGTDHRDFLYGIEDIRITKLSGNYLLVGCGKIRPPFKGENADRIAVYSTHDFKRITYKGMVAPFDSRNAVLFPEPINGSYWMLLRFYPNIHLERLRAGVNQLLFPSKYEKEWREAHLHRERSLLLEAGRYPHEEEKIGPGPPPIKTEKGWLVIYHGVGRIEGEILELYGLKDKISRGYSVNAALLDLCNPTKVLRRTSHPIYIPSAPYELYGSEEWPVDVEGVVFPVGAIVEEGRLLIYAGAGDKYVILIGCRLSSLLEYLWDEATCL